MGERNPWQLKMSTPEDPDIFHHTLEVVTWWEFFQQTSWIAVF